MIKTLAPAALIAAASLAFAASAEPPAPTASPAPHHGRSCFWTQDVNNFAAHDDHAVYLRVGVNQVYELKMFGNCFDLSWLHRLGIRAIDGSDICEGDAANVELFTRDIATGPQRCPVTSVRKLTPPEVAALPKDARP